MLKTDLNIGEKRGYQSYMENLCAPADNSYYALAYDYEL